MNIDVKSKQINTLVVAQNLERRRQIASAVSGADNIRIVDNVSAIYEIERSNLGGPLDVVVLEVTEGGADTLMSIRNIRQMDGSPYVVAVSSSVDSSLVRNVLGSGASGYVIQEVEDIHLCRAIEGAISNEIYLCPKVTGILVQSFLALTRFENDDDDDYQTLSAREKQVFALLADGGKEQDIADELLIGLSTVQTYRKRIMRKLGLHSKVELVKYSLKRGLTSVNF